MEALRCTFGRFFKGTFWKYILFPFLTSRVVLCLVAWFAQYFNASADYVQYAKRGYFISPYFLVDIWSRWDAEWYLDIVKSGYAPFLAQKSTASNIAFFPLYPLIVKLLAWPFNLHDFSATITLAIGVLVSSVCFLAAAYLLYKLVAELFGSERKAQWTILLLMAFPAAFFFSTFYAESLFLLLSVATFYLAYRKHWVWAAGMAALAVLSRPLGIFLLVPLAWMYLQAHDWKLKAIRADCLAFLLPVIALLGFLGYLYTLTGDPLALFHAEASWGRLGGSSLGNLIQQLGSHYKYVFRIDAGLFVLCLAAALSMLFSKRLAGQPMMRALGIYALLLIGFPVATGVWISLSRFLAVAFPVFILLADACVGEGASERRREFSIVLFAFFIAIQALYFLGWTRYYFIA